MAKGLQWYEKNNSKRPFVLMQLKLFYKMQMHVWYIMH